MNQDLRTAIDHQQITTLLARIAHLADDGDPVAYTECFTQDAVWELTDATGLPMDVQRIEGRGRLLAGVRERRSTGIQGPGSHTRHDISTILVEVDGDRAMSRCYFRYLQHTDDAPQTVAMGVYHDEFVRTAGGWLLHHRTITRG